MFTLAALTPEQIQRTVEALCIAILAIWKFLERARGHYVTRKEFDARLSAIDSALKSLVDGSKEQFAQSGKAWEAVEDRLVAMEAVKEEMTAARTLRMVAEQTRAVKMQELLEEAIEIIKKNTSHRR